MASHNVAVFDLDYTLLDDDSENRWAQFMFEHNLVNNAFVDRIAVYYEDYKKGSLNGRDYEEFLLRPLADNPPETMHALRDEYLKSVRRMIRPRMAAHLKQHRNRKDSLLLLSASNSFLVEPIGVMLGFPNHKDAPCIISSEVEITNGKYTGRLAGGHNMGHGKVQKFTNWLETNHLGLGGSWGYGDSLNDLPILMLVEHPVAVSPDPVLRQHAVQNNWEIID